MSDIKISQRVAFILESVSVTIILILCIAVYVHNGGVIDTHQLALKGAEPGGIVVGMVLAIFAFVGFESAGALGQEAKDPAQSVPRAILWSCGIIGVFYLIVVYAQIYGFGDAGFAKATAPLPQLASRRRPRRARPLHRDRHHLLDVRLRAGLPDRGLADAAVPRPRRAAAEGLHAHLQAHPRARTSRSGRWRSR